MKKIYFLISLILFTMGFDCLKVSVDRQYLNTEANALMQLLEVDGKISNRVLIFLQDKNYQMEYENKNYQVGDLLSFSLIKQSKLLLFSDIEIKIDRNVILLGY